MKRKLLTSERKLFDTALRLRRRGQLDEALVILRRLHRGAPDDAIICALIGDIHWDQGKLSSAIQWFRKATRAQPTSELASLGLFHVLWEANKENLARAEMRRFLEVADSKEYRTIQKELQSKTTAA